MNKTVIINLKTDPELKEKATKVAGKLGVSLSAVLNNELRRFANEENVVFAAPEIPNAKTKKTLALSRRDINKGAYLQFKTNKKAIDFLSAELK